MTIPSFCSRQNSGAEAGSLLVTSANAMLAITVWFGMNCLREWWQESSAWTALLGIHSSLQNLDTELWAEQPAFAMIWMEGEAGFGVGFLLFDLSGIVSCVNESRVRASSNCCFVYSFHSEFLNSMSETEHRHAGEMFPSGFISLKSFYHTVQVPDM